MNNQNDYILKRTDRSFYSFQSIFYIPKNLKDHFQRKQFKIQKMGSLWRCVWLV